MQLLKEHIEVDMALENCIDLHLEVKILQEEEKSAKNFLGSRLN